MLKDKLYTILATGFYSGKMPFAQGTWGSILAVLIWFVFNRCFYSFHSSFIERVNSYYVIVLMWVLIITGTFFLGIKSANYYCKKYNKDDAKEVVIDEFCGQWITLLIAFLSFGILGGDIKQFSNKNVMLYCFSYFGALILPLILFRIFDIRKPSIIGWVDANVKGGLGVMLDDVLAGFFAGLTFFILLLIYCILA